MGTRRWANAGLKSFISASILGIPQLLGLIIVNLSGINIKIPPVLHMYFYNSQPAALVYVSACLTTNHEVAGSIPGTSPVLMWIMSGRGSTQPREDNWVAN